MPVVMNALCFYSTINNSHVWEYKVIYLLMQYRFPPKGINIAIFLVTHHNIVLIL